MLKTLVAQLRNKLWLEVTNVKQLGKLGKKDMLKKKGGEKEAAKEKREFYCDNGTIKLRPTTDADIPLTDKEMKANKK